jgi:hypothetical protein
MADNIKYRFIQNVGDYFPSGYFGEDFLEKVQKCAGLSNEDIKNLCSPFVRLQHDYDEYKNFIINHNPRVEDAIKKTHDFNTQLLKILGYETDHAYQEHCVTGEDTEPIEMIPVRHILRQGQQVKMFVMEMQHLIATGDEEPAGLFEQQYESEPDRNTKQQKYSARQWRFVFELDKEKYKISPAIINKAVTQIFLLPEKRRPHFILMLAGNVVFLFDKDKWARGSYLEFSLDELFAQARVSAFRNYYALFHMLVSKQTLAADGEMVLMDTIIEESYKNAYEVTKDLKEGVIFAVETLANEALYYMKEVAHRPFGKYDKETDTYDETNDDFEAEVKDDCLTIIYRLLFLFYAESREELEILPVGDEVYKRGYSLESLRDLEMVRLNSQESRDGYFFDDSIRHLFSLLSDGHNAGQSGLFKSFRVRPIDSPLFNDKNLHHLGEVRIRNIKWQEIIKALSLSKKKNYCGRISYANLGVNQLGSVYESLLAFRGFYAEEDYIEVHKANDPSDGTFLVPYSRMGDFDISEVLCNQETGEPIILPKGTFVYRLNGRDRQKSASYYTPEVLTRSTVKYTLKSIIDDVAAGKRKATDLLELKILEPAMGAAAFQNEVINQLAEAYLTYQQQQQRERGLKNWRIQPDKYRDELQKVKAFIATHNVYGVDLNPTAIELGKLSLWLNVIHKDMETPFFANRLAVGNAVIGAWLKVYSRQDIYGIKGPRNRLLPNKWWEKAPHKVKFFQNRVNRSVNDVYHFLLPDANMLGVRSIREQKQAHPNEYRRMTTILSDWTAPITDYDFKTLQRLSSKIDLLLKEYYTDQLSIDKYTNNRNEVWDGIDHADTGSLFKEEEQAESYAKKQQLFDTRYRRDNAYRKLKLAMDYWCALWFWEYDDANDLPTRQEYWADIEALLDVDNDKLDRRTRQALERVGSDYAAEDMPEYGTRMTEEESEIVTKTQEELLTESHGSFTLFADDEPLRLKIADRLAKRYRFFHPMLEFIEVFWLRDGFDIICGNPPWVNNAFDELGIISEKYPEVAIRKISAPEIRKKRDEMFQNMPITEHIYRTEEIGTACTGVFINAYCNYPLLQGMRINLYKCVLENGFTMLSDKGFMGLLHPETVYDDPKGQLLRREIYPRLRYHFQYANELTLFSEVDHHTKYGEQIYGSKQESIDFLSIHNLFHPGTIDGCFVHDGHGLCGGIKDDNGKWNVNAHHDRIVRFTETELRVLSEAFEDGADWQSVKLTSIHANGIIKTLEAFSLFPSHVGDMSDNVIVSEGLNETTSVDKGWMTRNVKFPVLDEMELIYSGPHFFVGNPLYKTPKSVCELNSDYDIIDICKISNEFCPRTNYTPTVDLMSFRSIVQGFKSGQDSDGKPIYDDWTKYYHVGFRRMVGPTSERTLSGAILMRNCNHIGGVVSTTFKDYNKLIEFAGLTHSIVLDFYIKTLGVMDIHASRVYPLPLGIADKFKPSLFVRTLMLNCLTNHYADLWQEMWKEEYKNETWSIEDKRLKPFASLIEQWQWATPLRNYFERRQALVEIDVIAAMVLGLSLQDLEMIYTIQFPVLQQNENDTWYDAEGKIVFTCSKGLTGVGLDRPAWNAMRGNPITDADGTVIAYEGAEPQYTHTIDPRKSELYGGQQQTFIAPYNRCDRIADYRTAWAHFEKIFNQK